MKNSDAKYLSFAKIKDIGLSSPVNNFETTTDTHLEEGKKPVLATVFWVAEPELVP